MTAPVVTVAPPVFAACRREGVGPSGGLFVLPGPIALTPPLAEGWSSFVGGDVLNDLPERQPVKTAVARNGRSQEPIDVLDVLPILRVRLCSLAD